MADGYVLDRFRLDGRTAIINGVGPIIGERVARAFAEVGANVVVSARTEQKVMVLAADIIARGGKAIGVRADAASQADRERLVASANDAFGPVHVLFNNASVGSIPIDQTIWDNDDAIWEAAFQTNLMAPFKLAKLVAPQMIEAGYGSIINLLTCAAITPILPQIAYGSTKAGLQMMTRYLAKACAPKVRVNAICPGSISADGSVNPKFAEHIRNVPLGRPGLGDELVGAALFLASSASSYTTGQTLYAEGGRTHTVA